MAMDKGDMAKAIIDGFSEPDKPADAMGQFSDSLKGYLEDNLEVKYTWVATLPPPTPTPDPITSFTSSVKFPAFELSNPPNLLAWGPLLMTAVVGGIIQHPSDFLVPPGTFTPIPFVITESKADNQEDAMEHVCGEIITGIKAMINAIPLPGTHLAFVVPTPGAIMASIL